MWKEREVEYQINDPQLLLRLGKNIDNHPNAEKYLNHATGKKSLDEAYQHLSELFPMPEYVIYRGSHLIALYQTDVRQYHYMGHICAKTAFDQGSEPREAA